MRKTAGFTLIELIIVLAILGIFFAIGAGSLPRDKFAINQAAKGLARDFQLARFEAISRNWFVGVYLDPTNNTYIIYCDNPKDAVTDCRRSDFSPDSSTTASDKKYTAGSDVVLKTVTLANDYGTLIKFTTSSTSATIFDPRGTMYNVAAKTITFTNANGNNPKRVVLSQQGRARIE